MVKHMKPRSSPLPMLSRVALIGACGLVFAGCGTKITPIRVTHPTNFQSAVRKTGVDIDSQGGVDDVQAHTTASGFRVMNVSIGGSTQKIQASSASVTVNGGIYVQ